MVSSFQPNQQSLSSSSSAFDPHSGSRTHGKNAGASFLSAGNDRRSRGRSSDLSDTERNKKGPAAKIKNPFLKNLDPSLNSDGGNSDSSSSSGRFANKKRGVERKSGGTGVGGGTGAAGGGRGGASGASGASGALGRGGVGGGNGGWGRKGPGYGSGSDNERNSQKSRDAPRMPRQFLGNGSNGALAGTGSRARTNDPRPNSASSMSSFGQRAAAAGNDADDNDNDTDNGETDLFARKVFDRLHKDGINPPAWPSQPGNPKSKAEMARFREQYEEYRKNVRASLTKAGLIDDPDKRKTLQDAIDFRGICQDMCPEYEKITRITESDVPYPEKDPSTSLADRARMVKKLARSAAGQEAPLPMDVRSPACLRRTLDYLVDDLLQDDENLPGLHGFLWDRTRAIRRDFAFLSSPTSRDLRTQAYVLENIVRFHVTSLHLLSQEGKAGEDFVEQQELEQMGKALLSLRDVYDDCAAQGIQCENEADFRAYHLIFHANDPNTLEMLQRQWKPSLWRDSDEIRTAVSLVEALQTTVDFHGPLKHAPSLAASNALFSYFRIVESTQVSYIMACFAECHFPQLRRSMLRVIRRAMARPKDTTNDVTVETLNRFLRFDTIQQVVDFAMLHDVEVVPDPQAPFDQGRQTLLLNNKGPMPLPRLPHQFSQSIVERKRGNLSLPDVIHGAVSVEGLAPPSLPGGDTTAAAQPEMVKAAPQVVKPNTTVAAAPSPTLLPPSSTSPFAPIHPPSTNLAGTASSASASPFGVAGGMMKGPPGGMQSNPFAPSSSSSSTNTPAAVNPFAASPFSSAGPQVNSLAPKQPAMSPAFVNPFASITPAPQSTQPQGAASAFPQPPNPFASLLQPATAGAAPTARFPSLAPAEKAPETKSSVLSAAASTSQLSGNESKSTTSPFGFRGAADGIQKQPASNPFFPPSSTPAQASAGGVSQGGPSAVPSVLSKPKSSSAGFPVPSFNLGSTSFHPPTAPAQQPTETPSFQFSVTEPSPGPLPPSLNATQSQQAPSLIPPSSSASAFNFKPSQRASSSSGTGGSLFPTPVLGKPAQSTTPPTSPPRKPQLSTTVARRPRDLLGDFTKWFVLGDGGLLHEFEVFMVERLLTDVFDRFTRDAVEKQRKEKERQDKAEATRFRSYNLQLKYFYRWKQNARERRLRELRKSGREQFKAFREAQRAARQREEDEAADKIARQQDELAKLDRSKEMASVLRKSTRHRRATEEALLASGVLSGVPNERETIAQIVRAEPGFASSQMMLPPPPINGDHRPVRSRSGSIASTASALGGSKTRALREELLGSSKTERFRRSLPSFSPDGRSTPERTPQASKVSERWRLKAMGIVQMPDGTALPESMVSEIRHGMARERSVSATRRRSSLASTGHSTSYHFEQPQYRSHSQQRRPSPSPHRLNMPDREDPSLAAIAQKRKRPISDDGPEHSIPSSSFASRKIENTAHPAAATTTTAAEEQRRGDAVLSEAEVLIRELRAMRQEMEEGTTWFKAQNGRLQSEAMSRDSSVL